MLNGFNGVSNVHGENRDFISPIQTQIYNIKLSSYLVLSACACVKPVMSDSTQAKLT